MNIKFDKLIWLVLVMACQACKKSTVQNVDVKEKTAIVSTFAGNTNITSSVDGTGEQAGFGYITGIAFDPSGNLFVVDDANKIRKITAGGVVSTYFLNLVNGYANLNISNPADMVVDGAGNIFATTSYGKITKISPDKTVTLLAGYSDGRNDGTGANASFREPFGIVQDVSGNFFIADAGNGLIRKVTQAGVVTTFAGNITSATIDGTGTSASFKSPTGICIDSKGNIFVSDNAANVIRKITPAGVVTTFAGNGTKGFVDGTGTAASFSIPQGMTIDALDNLYIADSGNYAIRKVTPNGVVTTVAGTGKFGFVNGPGATAQFSMLIDVAVDKQGNLYVGDTGNRQIRKITFQ
ncbi:MAG: hypothetical protein ABI367_07275 [Mucilaginibacter sp.]